MSHGADSGPGEGGPFNFNSRTPVLVGDVTVCIPVSNTRKRPGTMRQLRGQEEEKEGLEGLSHMYSKVAAKSTEARNSVVIPLTNDGHL